MEVVIVLAALLCAVVLIAAPFRSGRAINEAAARSADRAELEAAKEAKYREIREAEFDYRTGKLSEDDWRAVDSGLRAEAVDLLRRLDAMREQEG
jgi:type II secretory pathway pseudopilin PulG